MKDTDTSKNNNNDILNTRPITASQIRTSFLRYFAAKGHEIIASSSLVPENDPTLLFANAGMNQFKEVFLGAEKRSYNKATSAQKCVRAGGKHNDLDNVGFTARHHTFFEMLGNFSFGDYFKQDAIKFAWGFLTSELKISPQSLYVTVYHTDDEAYNIWHNEIGLSTDRIIRIGDKPNGGSDNFWQMGDTGPCGPCTEIFYDHGENIQGGLPGTKEEDGDRYIEIWNCVFMQYNRSANGELTKLPKPSVDTGMGLERISAVMQGVHNNYEIDIFTSLISKAAEITNTSIQGDGLFSLRVLADHIRSISFLIADGVSPSNDGRGYVLRRIMRRAIRHGYKLGMKSPFLYMLVETLTEIMGDAYSELILSKEHIEHVIKSEEEKFFQTIENGMGMLLSFTRELQQNRFNTLSGDIAFKLYDTYGFPLDLTQDICREYAINVDVDQFDQAMDNQRNMARGASKFKANINVIDYEGVTTNFLGYVKNSITSKVTAIYDENKKLVTCINGDDLLKNYSVILEDTVFYPEGGGQVGDTGVIEKCGGAELLFLVRDTQKVQTQVFAHYGNVKYGSLSIGDEVVVTYDVHRRLATTRNHSATHLLHKALHTVLGSSATQKGSLVCPMYTRFDFAYDKPLTQVELFEVERLVNHAIFSNYEVSSQTMSYDEAIKAGALALFNEKYSDDVRVINMGNYSVELCGGTHVKRTGDIGMFIITSESGVASGVRRIEALTGELALAYIQENFSLLNKLRNESKAQSYPDILVKTKNLTEDNTHLKKDITTLKQKMVAYSANEYLTKAETMPNGTKLIILSLENVSPGDLLPMVDDFKSKLGNAIIVIGVVNADKVNLIVGVTKAQTANYHAGKIVAHLAGLLGGKGGGRPDLAQAGASNIKELNSALNTISEYIRGL